MEQKELKLSEVSKLTEEEQRELGNEVSREFLDAVKKTALAKKVEHSDGSWDLEFLATPETYDKILELKGKSKAKAWAKVLLCKALLIMQSHKYREAMREEGIRCVDEAIKINPKLPHAYLLKVLTIADEVKDRFSTGPMPSAKAKALKIINNAIKNTPEYAADFLSQKAHLLEKNGRVEMAIKYYEKALDITPKDWKERIKLLLSDIGKQYLFLGQYKKALNYYARARDDAGIAIVFIAMGDEQKGLSLLEKAELTSPVMSPLTGEFLERGALEEGRIALDTNLDKGTVEFFKILALFKIGEYSEALESIDKKLEEIERFLSIMQPKGQQAMPPWELSLLRGLVLGKMGKDKEAIKELKKAFLLLEKSPNYLLSKSGQDIIKEAREMFKWLMR